MASELISVLSGADAPLVYLRTSTLCCLHSFVNTTEGADSVSGQMRGDKECPFSGVNNSGRAVWRNLGARKSHPNLTLPTVIVSSCA